MNPQESLQSPAISDRALYCGEIQVQPDTIKRLKAFFHRYPEVVAISRSMDSFLRDEPGINAFAAGSTGISSRAG